ncbi:MAG: hypothetical protein FWG80_02495 [Alphaproteobacteria bacterium]|nr:hypothetical protein [Alphaproteobacteria bacterium]
MLDQAQKIFDKFNYHWHRDSDQSVSAVFSARANLSEIAKTFEEFGIDFEINPRPNHKKWTVRSVPNSPNYGKTEIVSPFFTYNKGKLEIPKVFEILEKNKIEISDKIRFLEPRDLILDKSDSLTQQEIKEIFGDMDVENKFFETKWNFKTTEQIESEFSNQEHLSWLFSKGRLPDPYVSPTIRLFAYGAKYAAPYIPGNASGSQDLNFLHIYRAGDTAQGRLYGNFGYESDEPSLRISQNYNTPYYTRDKYQELRKANPNTDVQMETVIDRYTDHFHALYIHKGGNIWIPVPNKNLLKKAVRFYRAKKKLSSAQQDHLKFAAFLAHKNQLDL